LQLHKGNYITAKSFSICVALGHLGKPTLSLVPVDGLATLQQAMAEFMTGKLYITKLNKQMFKSKKSSLQLGSTAVFINDDYCDKAL
jgi:3'-phosphoadenosine 5'-phosphosulfate (PAPS) 3'-phosphatase